MKIEILGDGCTKCKALKNKVQKAVDELGLQAEVTSVMDPIRIADLVAMSLPQMVIDGNIAPSSKLSSIDSIKELLRTAGKQG